MSGWTSLGTFFSDADFDFETRETLGRVANGAGDVALVFATLDQITGRGLTELVRCMDSHRSDAGRPGR
jgi:hypothetical protein